MRKILHFVITIPFMISRILCLCWMYLFSIQLRPPRFSLEDFGLSWKDFGEQDALDLFISINTAIG